MPGLDPVAPHLALIDRIISLIQVRKTRQKDFFEKIIDPLYTQFVPLGEDTLALFREARKVSEGKYTLMVRQSDIEAIRALRNKFADTRSRLRALLEACEKNLLKHKNKELGDSVSAMSSFFAPQGFSGSSIASGLIKLFDSRAFNPDGDSEEVARGTWDFNNAELGMMVETTTETLESMWYEISGRYMELKLKYTVEQ